MNITHSNIQTFLGNNNLASVDFYGYLIGNSWSTESKDFVLWGAGYLADNPNVDFDALMNNKTDFDTVTGDNDNNESGGYDTSTYTDFNPQQNWPAIPSVIPANQFVGWNRVLHPSWQYMDYAKSQIAKMGYKISNYYDAGQTFQIYTSSSGVNQTSLAKGLSYLKYALSAGIPVVVGVDDAPGHPGNLDQTTDHFIVIVGMGTDTNGKYLSFYDNATSDATKGTNLNNKLYFDSSSGLISGTSQASPYAIGLTYTITMIRKSKTL